jgi:hypothetical protein
LEFVSLIAQALIATAMAASITGDEKYKQWHMQVPPHPPLPRIPPACQPPAFWLTCCAQLASYAFARFQHPEVTTRSRAPACALMPVT